MSRLTRTLVIASLVGVCSGTLLLSALVSAQRDEIAGRQSARFDQAKVDGPPGVGPSPQSAELPRSPNELDLKISDGLRTETFTLPSGATIIVNLPEDLSAGDTFTGTLRTEPARQDEKQRARGLAELNKSVLLIGGQPSAANAKFFTRTIPRVINSNEPFLILMINGEQVGSAKVSIAPEPPPTPQNAQLPTCGQMGRNVVIRDHCDGLLNPSDAVTIAGEVIQPLAESPRMRILENTCQTLGPTQIRYTEQGKQTSAKFQNFGVELSAGNLNLRRGQQTNLAVIAKGLQGLSQDATLDVVNKSPAIINMEGGNAQHFDIRPSDVAADGTYRVQRTLTGNQQGAFEITATVRCSPGPSAMPTPVTQRPITPSTETRPPPMKPSPEPSPQVPMTTTPTHVQDCSLTTAPPKGGLGIQLEIVSPANGDSKVAENEPAPLIVKASDGDQMIQTCTCRVDGQVKCSNSKVIDLVDAVSYLWTQTGGAGKLLSAAGPSTLYQPPDLEIGKSDEVTLTVEVKDSRGNDKTATAIFTIATTRVARNEYKRTVSGKKETDPGRTITITGGACDCECQAPEWKVEPALAAGEVDGPIKICAGQRVILSLSAEDSDTLTLKCRGTCGKADKDLPMVDETVYEWSADLGSFVDHGGSATTNSRGTTAIYKAPDAGGKATISVSVTDSKSQAPDTPPLKRQLEVISYRLEMTDKNGAVLASPPPVTTERVGVRTQLKAKLTPADATAKFEWEVGGDRIKTYKHRIDDPAKHEKVALEAKHLEGEAISFFWTDEGNEIPVTVTVTVGGLKCKKTVLFNVSKFIDMNRQLYNQKKYTKDPALDGSPDFDTMDGHRSWHRQLPVDGEDPPFSDHNGTLQWGDKNISTKDYNGRSFLFWHRALIDTHVKWRETFHVGAYMGQDPPPGAPARPEYLKLIPAADSPEESKVFKYVRLGEFQNENELGIDVVSPWHNSGHGAIGTASGFSDMKSSATATRTEEDTFWKWHELVDAARKEWKTDQATIVTVSPADGTTVQVAPDAILIGFDKRVSSQAGLDSANTIHIWKDKLTVNGSPAKNMDDAGSGTKFMLYRFTGFAEPAEGTVTVELKGTASYAGKTYTFTFKKP